MELYIFLICTCLLGFIQNVIGNNIFCFYLNWTQYRPELGRFVPENIDPHLCTHIIYAYAGLNSNRVYSTEWNDDDTDWTRGMYSRINDLKRTNSNLKTLLAVGGWNQGILEFNKMVGTPENRAAFITDTITFLRSRNFDGITLDFKYPEGPTIRNNTVLLLEEMQAAYDAEASASGQDKLIVTMTAPASKYIIDAGYNMADVGRASDWVLYLTIDFYGEWNPSTGHHTALYPRTGEPAIYESYNIDWTVNYVLSLGCPAEKLVLGLATYGRGWTLTDPNNNGYGAPTSGASLPGDYTRGAGMLAYYEVCLMRVEGNWNDEHRVPNAVSGNQWIGYDDPRSIGEKMTYVQTNNLAGVVVWSLDTDDFSGQFCPTSEAFPLISAAKELLK